VNQEHLGPEDGAENAIGPFGKQILYDAFSCALNKLAGSKLHVSQVKWLGNACGLMHALNPSAAAGRVPLPPIGELLGSHVTAMPVPAIGTPPAVQDQFASELPSPLHFKLHVYGRSPMDPAEDNAAALADGAVVALRSVQPARTTAPTSSPVIPIALMLSLQSVRTTTLGSSLAPAANGDPVCEGRS